MKTIPVLQAWRALCAACATGGALLLATAALAHGGHQVAATGRDMPVDHSHHGVAARGDSYRRSIHAYDAIPDVVLTDSYTRPVRLRELLMADEPVLLNFVFTTCTTICPVMTKVFADVRTRLGDDANSVRMVSISIDPEHDTPAQLKAYAHKFEAGERWTFLTGRVQDVAAVQRAFDSYDSDKMNHQPLTLLRGAPGKPWVRIDGFASPDELALEYRKVMRR